MNGARLADEIARDISDALARGGFGAAYTIKRAVDSGSRRNYVLQVHDPTGRRRRVWCRATTRAIDEALGGNFTLAREASVLDRLAGFAVPVPLTLSRSQSGRTILQSYIHAATVDPEVAISRYMRALDQVHGLDPWQVFADPSFPATDAGAWLACGDAPDELVTRVGAALELVERLEPPMLEGPDELVHGDAGRANFVIDAEGCVWLVDWELVHAGSRFEDYAWCELRGLEDSEALWRREPLPGLWGW